MRPSRARSFLRTVALLGIVAWRLATAPFALAQCPAIETLLKSEPAGAQAFVGLRMVRPSGEVLCEYAADKLFTPASNAKLFTAALALFRLGPDYRFHTRVLAQRPPGPDGRLEGDLYVVGGGDPFFSERPIPYRINSRAGDPARPLEMIAEALAARGLREVTGDIVIDNSRYLWEPYPPGWSLEDITWSYGAPVTALAPGENSFLVTIRPGAAPGQPARVEAQLRWGFYSLVPHIETVSRGPEEIEVFWLPGSRQIHLFGRVRRSDAPRLLSLAIRDPAQYAGEQLRRCLESRGVVVRGTVRVNERWDPRLPPRYATSKDWVELYDRVSAPLLEILRVMMKDSINLAAELVLREVAYVERGTGSRKDGLEILRQFLLQLGIAEDQVYLEDGSGLSPGSLVSPKAVTQLLRVLYCSREREPWLQLLAVSGQDGTLRERLSGPALAGRVQAKTGTLRHTVALSGYAWPDREPVIFSIFINHFPGRENEARRLVDELTKQILASGLALPVPATGRAQ